MAGVRLGSWGPLGGGESHFLGAGALLALREGLCDQRLLALAFDGRPFGRRVRQAQRELLSRSRENAAPACSAASATVGQFVGAAVAAVVLTVVAVSLTEGVELRRAGEAGASPAGGVRVGASGGGARGWIDLHAGPEPLGMVGGWCVCRRGCGDDCRGVHNRTSRLTGAPSESLSKAPLRGICGSAKTSVARARSQSGSDRMQVCCIG